MKRALLLLAVLAVPASHAARLGGAPVALVTAETQNRLVAVDLDSGRVLGRLHMPADPQNVEVDVRATLAAVVSPRAGAVTIVDVKHLRIRKVIRGFGSPHIAAISPRGGFAYVTDDTRGQLVVIGLARGRVIRRVFVGVGAHHMSFSPNARRLWIALGERARTIVVVNTARLDRPRVIGSFEPGGFVHDVAFAPGGRRVWLTHEDSSTVTIVDARTRAPVASFAAGRPPQHVTFSDFELSPAIQQHLAFVTSGYDGTLRVLAAETYRRLRTLRVAYGSFNVSTVGGVLATTSLLRGTLTQFWAMPPWRRVRAPRLAPATRDVALAVLP